MDKKDINLLPEDLRQKKIQIPKIKIERSFDLSKPEKIEKVRKEKVELKKSVPKIEPERKEEKRENKGDEEKTQKGIFTIAKAKPDFFSQLKSIFTTPVKGGFSFKNFLKLIKEKTERAPSFHLNVNLLLKEGDVFGTKEKNLLKKLYLEAIVCLIIILIFSAYLFFLDWNMGDEGKKIRKEISIAENQITVFKKEEKKLINIQKKVLYIKDLLNQHIYWTRFFALLEKYTLPDVYYTDFSSSINQPLALNGIAKNSQTLVGQVITLQNAADFVDEMEAKDISLVSENTDEVSFTLNLVLNPDIFLKD